MDKRDPVDTAEHRPITPAPRVGGMYRRAEVRSYAESGAAAPSFAPPYEPHAGASGVVPDVSEAVPRVTSRPVPSGPSATLRQRRLVTAAIAAVILVAVWVARRPDPGTRNPVRDQQNAPAAAAVASTTPTPTPAPAREAATATPAVQSPAPPSAAQPVLQARPARPSLVVTSDPDGARVTVDGIGWGNTPLTVRYLPPGTKRIRASKDGYLSQERVVAISGETQRLQIRLPRRPPSGPNTSIALQVP